MISKLYTELIKILRATLKCCQNNIMSILDFNVLLQFKWKDLWYKQVVGRFISPNLPTTMQEDNRLTAKYVKRGARVAIVLSFLAFEPCYCASYWHYMRRRPLLVITADR